MSMKVSASGLLLTFFFTDLRTGSTMTTKSKTVKRTCQIRMSTNTICKDNLLATEVFLELLEGAFALVLLQNC